MHSNQQRYYETIPWAPNTLTSALEKEARDWLVIALEAKPNSTVARIVYSADMHVDLAIWHTDLAIQKMMFTD